jgi:hypothetical protein
LDDETEHQQSRNLHGRSYSSLLVFYCRLLSYRFFVREDLAGGPARALERLATVPLYCCCEQVLTADQTLLQLPVPIRQRNWLVTHLQLGKFSPDQLFGNVTPRGAMAPNSA